MTVESPNRILIIKPSALGDIATTLPLLCDLKAVMPEAQIDWLIQPNFAPLIQDHDALHQWIGFDRKKLSAWWYKPKATGRFTGLLKTLRDNDYDIVIDAQGLLRSGFLTRITGAKVRIGFAHAREGATLAYTHKVFVPGGNDDMLAVDRMRTLGQILGTDLATPAQFRLPISPAARSAAESLVPVSTPFVAIVPGARWATKRWPLERYTGLTRRLLDSAHSVVLLGSPDEKPLADQIQSELAQQHFLSAHLLNLAGQTDLPTLVALLARAQLVIGNDSGPLHIAAALGTPVIALFGPTRPEAVGPYGQLEQVLRHDVPCHPCRRRTCGHHSCMQGLVIERVWEKSEETLGLRHK